MVNPDGVTLSQQGTAGLSADLAKTLKQYNGNSTNFNRWKANMQGIDLNRQGSSKNLASLALPSRWQITPEKEACH
ncbi:hypothetical protein [Paenibacillus motobuensis]|uniref:Uncharacterized protein n=1 Tax=Paenibacillus motobuensis TaxID=295324 RepID=A0ABP3I2R4_9BACL